MSTTRREFVRTTAVAAAGVAMAPFAPSAWARTLASGRPSIKSLLILGGTGFIGPAVQEAAIARGYSVTLFNRGRAEDRRKQAGGASVVSDGVTVLYGNRDPDKTADADNDESKGEKKDPNSPRGLTQLEGRKFDAVVDTSGYFPRMVKASAQLLAPSARQYLFISTVAVYKDRVQLGGDTTGERPGGSGIVLVIMGAITGSCGGVIRDVLCSEIPLVLRGGGHHAAAALAGAAVYHVLHVLGQPPRLAASPGLGGGVGRGSGPGSVRPWRQH